MPVSRKRKRKPVLPHKPAAKFQSGRRIDFVAVMRGWLFRVVVFTALTFFYQERLQDKLYFTGDEPHYLMAAISLMRDGDFNLYNNYQQQDYRHFGYRELVPQWGELTPGMIEAEHGTAFPALIAPVYAAVHLDWLRWILIGLGLLTCFAVAATADHLTEDRLTGTVAGSLLLISPTWQMQASRIYPETIAGLLATAVAWMATRIAVQDRTPGRVVAAAAGFFLVALPSLYLRYAPIAGPLAVLVLSLRTLRRSSWTYLGGAAAGALGILNVVLFRDQGALGGAMHARLFAADHPWLRYWPQFLDRYHGIVAFQPFAILGLWAMIHYLLPRKSPQSKVLFGLALVAGLYTAMYAFWLSSPGASMPGRYLAAILPLLCILIAVWARRPGPLRRVRTALLAIGCLWPLVLHVAALWRELAPYEVLQTSRWRVLPKYWDIWEAGEIVPVGAEAIYVLLAIVATKAAAYMWSRRRHTAISAAGDSL